MLYFLTFLFFLVFINRLKEKGDRYKSTTLNVFTRDNPYCELLQDYLQYVLNNKAID